MSTRDRAPIGHLLVPPAPQSSSGLTRLDRRMIVRLDAVCRRAGSKYLLDRIVDMWPIGCVGDGWRCPLLPNPASPIFRRPWIVQPRPTTEHPKLYAKGGSLFLCSLNIVESMS